MKKGLGRMGGPYQAGPAGDCVCPRCGQKTEYLIAALDFYLAEGIEPVDAWSRVLKDYAYVYHVDDGCLPLARAAEIALRYLEKTE